MRPASTATESDCEFGGFVSHNGALVAWGCIRCTERPRPPWVRSAQCALGLQSVARTGTCRLKPARRKEGPTEDRWVRFAHWTLFIGPSLSIELWSLVIAPRWVRSAHGAFHSSPI